MNSISRYLGSGQSESSTMSSKVSATSRTACMAGNTSPTYLSAWACAEGADDAFAAAASRASSLDSRLEFKAATFSRCFSCAATSALGAAALVAPRLLASCCWYLIAEG
jgi:hypothetical protein